MEEKIGKYFGKIINFIYNFVSSTLFLVSPAIVILNKVFDGFEGFNLLIYLLIFCFFFLQYF